MLIRQFILCIAFAFTLTQCGLPNCPIYNCQVRQQHDHSGAKYSGRKWYKKQNLQVGERWKAKKYATEIQVNDGLAEHNAKAIAHQAKQKNNSAPATTSDSTQTATASPIQPTEKPITPAPSEEPKE